jgi:hypothetical protein
MATVDEVSIRENGPLSRKFYCWTARGAGTMRSDWGRAGGTIPPFGAGDDVRSL